MPYSLRALLVLVSGALVLLAGCRPVAPESSPTGDPALRPPVIESAGAADTVSIAKQEGITIVDIVSPRGIGRTQVQFPPDASTGSIELRFHLQGLEHAILDNGEMQIEITVASHPPYTVMQSLITGDGKTKLAKGDAYWVEVQLASGNGAPRSTPLRSGHIDLVLPNSFVDAHHRVLSVQWVDFYR